jgi:D-beta-D-heptose 7-phosphate kinase/D-beta-D-heptose 1-phosphate adenosyltransferase
MPCQALVQLLDNLPGMRILILGDVMLDEYVWGEVQRISPEAPVPVVDVRSRTHVPGGAANVAANITGLGGVAMLGGVIGSDHSAECLQGALTERRVDTSGLVVDPQRPTPTKVRVMAHSQQVVRLDSEKRDGLSTASEDALLGWTEGRIPEVQGCVLSDYGKGVVSGRLAQKFIGLARRAGKPVIVDPKGSDCARYSGATVIKPNLAEVQRLLNREVAGDGQLQAAGSELAALWTGTAVVITRGSQGMSLFRDREEPFHVASAARHVYDVTGAGDTVVSMLALALAAGATCEEAIQLANVAAGIVVGKLGTAIVTREELRTTLTH